MRRAFEEISDEEWEHHTFNPRLVLKKKSKPAAPPPPIESFSYRPKTLHQNGAPSSSFPSTINIDDSDDSDFKQEEIEEEEEETFKPSRPRRNVVRRRFVLEEDSDENEVIDIRSTGGDGEGDTDGVNWAELENDDDDDVDVEMEILTTGKNNVQERDVDLVGRALQKCAKISAALRQELYGSTARNCDRYAEIDASSCRIVTQVKYKCSPSICIVSYYGSKV
jgi:SWI/SNF-related matrix-associated actin-dependent regulator of chromatin subfamily A containing DEAD/H box 1